MKKVAITGSEGFIANHLIRNLRENGNFQIECFDIKNNIFEDICNFDSINSLYLINLFILHLTAIFFFETGEFVDYKFLITKFL